MTWFTVELQIEATRYFRIEATDRNEAQRWGRRARSNALYWLGEFGSDEEFAGIDSVEYRISKAHGPWAPPVQGGANLAAETAPSYRALQAPPPTERNPHPAHKRKQPPPAS